MTSTQSLQVMLYVSAIALPADKAMVSTIISAAVSISIRRLMAFTSFLWSWCTLQTACLNIYVTKWMYLVGVGCCPVATIHRIDDKVASRKSVYTILHRNIPSGPSATATRRAQARWRSQEIAVVNKDASL